MTNDLTSNQSGSVSTEDEPSTWGLEKMGRDPQKKKHFSNDFTKGPLAWMAQNTVAANLLMVAIIALGLTSLRGLKQEIFPEFEMDFILVNVPYPGASPEEVEQGIILAVEEQVRALDGVKKVYSTAAENIAAIQIELMLGADNQKVLTDVKNAIDRVTSFPVDVEEPQVQLLNPKSRVISLVVYGDRSVHDLHQTAERVRNSLLDDPNISQISLSGLSKLEIAVELDRERLEALGLTLGEVAAQIKQNSIEVPAGNIETNNGDVLLKVSDRRRSGIELEQMPILGSRLGGQLTLGDIATITDGYAQPEIQTNYKGQRAVVLDVQRTGKETPIKISDAVQDFVETYQKNVPDGISIDYWNDRSRILRGRIDLLVRNAKTGLILVLIVLALFLDVGLAFWVAMGIPISFLGAFFFMSLFGVSINMISLFALIVTLGMVVDDALIVGENIYSKRQEGYSFKEAALLGSKEMATPVTFAILTTIASFSPLLLVPGVSGKFFGILPIVVISVLVMSLLESFLVLPAHLIHENAFYRFITWLLAPVDRVRQLVARGLERYIEYSFKPTIRFLVKHRYVTAASAISLFLVTQGLWFGVLTFNFFPKLEGESISASVRLPYGVAVDDVERVRDMLNATGLETAQSYGEEHLVGMLTEVGKADLGGGPGNFDLSVASRNLLRVRMQLTDAAKRDFSTSEVATAWAEKIPEWPIIEEINFKSTAGPGGDKDLELQIRHADSDVVVEASNTMKSWLTGYQELINISSSHTSGKKQLELKMKPTALSEGLTSTQIGSQLRAAYFGAEAIREQRGREEIRVMVRLAEHQRKNISDLYQMQMKTPLGKRIALGDLVDIQETFSPSSVSRESGQRKVNISGNVAKNVPEPGPILKSVREELIPKLEQQYPGVKAQFVGREESRRETFQSLGRNGILALFAIFALLAIPFKSYTQPLIIISAIPFGMIGAIWGHWLMGFGLSIISYFGMVALAGVVINDSLVLIDATNQERLRGADAFDAIVYGACRRLRPILLTSLTTFFGLAPMIFETSIQARFLVPMAISLGFGILVATVMILTVVPCLYMILEDIRGLTRKKV